MLNFIDFSAEERKKYVLLEKEAKGLLERINHGEKNGYSFILELLLRMRQFSVTPRIPCLSLPRESQFSLACTFLQVFLSLFEIVFFPYNLII